MNIVLTGYRGTGKTTIGRALAQRLKREFIDTDDRVEALEGMSIREIFQKKGWQYFRRVEKKVIRKLSLLDDKVIAVGGGAFMYKDNLRLKVNAKIVLLIAPPEVLSERIQGDPNRPPLTDAQSSVEEIRAVWARRRERYYAVADIVVDTRDGNIERAVAEIMTQLGV